MGMNFFIPIFFKDFENFGQKVPEELQTDSLWWTSRFFAPRERPLGGAKPKGLRPLTVSSRQILRIDPHRLKEDAQEEPQP